MKFLVIILKEKNSNQKKVKFRIAFILVLYQSNNSFPPKNKNRHLGGFYISFFLDWTKKNDNTQGRQRFPTGITD